MSKFNITENPIKNETQAREAKKNNLVSGEALESYLKIELKVYFPIFLILCILLPGLLISNCRDGHNWGVTSQCCFLH
jgi:hypothetical protein